MHLYRFRDPDKGEVLVNTTHISEIYHKNYTKIIMTNGNVYNVMTGELDEVAGEVRRAAVT